MEHYYSRKPTSTITPQVLSLRINGLTYTFNSAAGVFSKDHIDPGTSTLLALAQLPTTGRILDLGCGIGIIGIVVQREHPKLTVSMSDVNERAVSLAKRNAAKNKVKPDIRAGDGLRPWEDEKFSTILFNPPQHAGKEVCFRLMQEAHAHLAPGGTLQLVIRRNKGGGSYSAEMERVFGNVEEIGKQSGFGVYVSEKCT